MKASIQNPFVISGYVSPGFFCDRKDESARIMKAIHAGRNLTLISLRRMGKTGLLKHVKHQLESKSKSWSVIYADLLPTLNGNDLLTTISNALIRAGKNEKNFLEKILAALSALRPALTIDQFTGQPSLELKAESPAMIQTGLDQILDLIKGINRNLVFMFDEFQQISNYPEKNIEHILRTIIQSYPAVHFIFSGSSRHMLENMFMSAGKPFYRSTELMYLERIEPGEYRKFIIANFGEFGIKIDDDAIKLIFYWTRLHTWYVQYVCNKIFESGEKKVNLTVVNRIFLQILTESEPEYVNYRNLLTVQQFKLLIALASEKGVEMPTSGKFISKYDLTSPSSVKTSLKSLSEKEMIMNENGKWLVYDVFFSRWLEYHYSPV
jgi:AAA+ ATPase superfamily predicted ATPase